MLQSGDVVNRNRVPEVDFWRGLMLVVILIDHIPRNVLDLFTPHNFGLSDAAEAFVFLSGVSVSLAYASKFQNVGFGALFRRCAARAAKLYFAQIALVASGIAIALVAAKVAGNEHIVPVEGLSRFIESPLSSLIGVATFDYQLNYLCILPLYTVLMLWAPVVLYLALRKPILAVLVSIAVYVVGRGHGGVQTESWSFNPFAWQLVFAIGIVCAVTWRKRAPPPQLGLIALALVIILGGAVLSIKAMGINATAIAHLDLDKSELGIMRLVHFLAAAYVIAAVSAVQPWSAYMGRMVSGWIGRRLQGMGRNSLLFFSFGSVASAGGRSMMAVANSAAASHYSLNLVGFAYTTAAIAAMFALERRISRRRRAPVGRSSASVAPLGATLNSLKTEESPGAAA